ncbi:hypothetical protein ACFLTH_08040 [Bacteroidota bacterium]
MNKKLSKLLYTLSENSRITSKLLSKKLLSSQQTASYMVNQAKKKKLIQKFNAIVDPIKLGFTNIIVGINYLEFNHKIQREIINELKETDSIIGIQETSGGIDLLVEYCVYNLSAFNKTHSEIFHKFHRSAETKFIYPVVVKHKYEKSYLTRKANEKDIVLCGDRETRTLNKNELSVLRELVREPEITFTKLSNKTKLSTKTIVNIKKRLEKQRIIRGYDCLFNHKKLGINKQIIFLKLGDPGINTMNALETYCSMNRNIVEFIKVIGFYEVIIIAESKEKINLINGLRAMFPISNYLVTDVENTIKESYVPENL